MYVDSIGSGGSIRKDNGSLEELKASIKEHGLLQLVTVYRKEIINECKK